MIATLRLLQIYKVAIQYQLGELLQDIPKAKWARWLLKLPLASKTKAESLNRGERLRLALEALGPIFIKFGQLLSTRRDLIPEDIADELSLLQDQVPPFDSDEAIDIIEKALDQKINTLFKQFTQSPLASASIAQVHAATLHSGEEVVVKVLRPGLDAVISSDIALLRKISNSLTMHFTQAKRLRLPEIVHDYETVIYDEINLLVEAANTSQLGRNFKDSEQLYVPKIYWDYCRKNVMVAERINGIPVNQVDELKQEGINLKKLAETGVQIFFTQVFNHSYFHADMHPGNVFVSRQHKENPQYIALDCAIIGTLSKSDQQYLARNMLAIFQRDYRKVAELHVECGWVPDNTSVNAFETTMRSLCEPIFEKPLSEISFAMMLLQLFHTAGRYDMEIQPSLVLLQKTMLNIEGLGKQLYPDLDLWATALPFLEDWQRRRLSPLNNLKIIKEKLPEWIEKFPEIPELVYESLNEHRHSRQHLQNQVDHYLKENTELKRKSLSKRRKFGAFLLFAGLISLFPGINAMFESLSTASSLFFVLGLGFLLYRS